MRTAVIGDIHGCPRELDDLLAECGHVDEIVSVGDLVDRGPDPVSVVRRFREEGWKAVLGNHEETALRWLRHEERRERDGTPNPMRPPAEERRLQWLSLSGEDVAWLRSLPVTLRVQGWHVVHAGFETGVPLEEQRTDRMVRVRYVDVDGKMAPFENESMDQPAGSTYWTERWEGPGSVLYGHAVHSLSRPRVDRRGPAECVGIDTGCVFGGALTAAVVTGGSYEIVQVRARRAYAAWPDKAGPRPEE